MRYRIVKAKDLSELEDAVNVMFTKGWTTVGGITHHHENGTDYLIQGMLFIILTL